MSHASLSSKRKEKKKKNKIPIKSENKRKRKQKWFLSKASHNSRGHFESSKDS